MTQFTIGQKSHILHALQDIAAEFQKALYFWEHYNDEAIVW